jgi:hypothetical protein
MTLAEKQYQQTIAKITATALGYEDHGMFSAAVSFSYGGSCQGFGPIGLGTKDSIAGPLIEAILNAAGVESWEKVKGRTVYALRDDGWNGLIRGMAPLPTETGKGFILSEGVILPWTVD